MTNANIDAQRETSTLSSPRDVVLAYFAAGNESDVDGAAAVFADDAVLMAEGWETATFEVEAALLLANARYIVVRTPEPIERARRAIHHRVGLAAHTART